MAVAAIDATLADASANSYVTEVQALAYFEIHPDGDVWTGLDAEARRAALLFATKLIDRETYWGQKSAAAQALKFPRTGQTALPLQVQEAQYEQALDLVTKGYTKRLRVIEMKEMGVRQVTTGDAMQRMSTGHPFAFPMYKLSPTARELLSGFMESGIMVGRA